MRFGSKSLLLSSRRKPAGRAGWLIFLLLFSLSGLFPVNLLASTIDETKTAPAKTMAEAAKIGEAEALARWKAFPRYGRRCRLGTERASLRIGPKMVLHQIRWNAGVAGPDAVAYADLHAGDKQAQEKEFADTVRKSCRKALKVEPLTADPIHRCRGDCPNLPDLGAIVDLDYVVACHRCRVENAAKSIALRIRSNGVSVR